MLNLPPDAWALIDAVPFPDHDGGLFGNGHAVVRPWLVDHCTGDLNLYPSHTSSGIPKAEVTFDRTKLSTVLAAAHHAWPDTVRSLPAPPAAGPPRLASAWLPELLPLAQHNARETRTLYQKPILRLRFTPAPDTTLWINFPPDTTDTTCSVLGGMDSYDYAAVTRFMHGLHDHA